MQGKSVTVEVSSEMIKQMHEEAEKVWAPELVRIFEETENPFINTIYDSEPLEQISWDSVVLVGDSAHPVTPHGARSTNMAILDAAISGKCLEQWGPERIRSALGEFQSIRLPVESKQVLHSRRMSRIKQGLALPDGKPFNPESTDAFLFLTVLLHSLHNTRSSAASTFVHIYLPGNHSANYCCRS